VCEGDQITLTAMAGFNAYDWSDNQNGQTITVSTGGTYWVDITDANNCVGRDSIDIVVVPSPNANLTLVGDSICANGGFASYAWTINGTPSAATGSCISAVGGGTFGVVVTDANGCTGSDSILVVGTVDPSTAGFFTIFPNPAGNELNVKVNDPIYNPGEIRVFDVAGRIVLQQEFRRLTGTTTLNLSKLPEGTFIVEVQAGDQKARKSVVHIR
jgi:hypothetical protein